MMRVPAPRVSKTFLVLLSMLWASDAAYADVDAFRGIVLHDQAGHPVGMAQLRGHPVLLNFVYTHCTTSCPVQTRDLVEIQRALAGPRTRGTERVLFLSVTIDPEHDTPALLKSYALAMGADLRRWKFVTGSVDAIDLLRTRLDSPQPGQPRPAVDAHATELRLFAADGRLMQRYVGSPIDRARITREIQQVAALPKTPRMAAN